VSLKVRGRIQAIREQFRSDILTTAPGSFLLHFKNEGASGDVDENKGKARTGARF
jgi:hypothetical protein